MVAQEAGYEAWLCIVVQMEGMREFRPNDQTDPAFGEALRQAAKAGVHICAYSCQVTPDSLAIGPEVPVIL
jgi:sugar fermentation stimulation protein A